MKLVIREVPYGWKTTAIVLQKANSHYTSRPIQKLGLVTRQFGYRYVEVDMNWLGFWLCEGVQYESHRATDRAIEMMTKKWQREEARLLKRKDSILL
jgi:hypothetical protein